MSRRAVAARTASRLLALGAVGEIAIAVAILALPAPVMGLLLAAHVAGLELVVARMLGAALVALGVTWWLTKSHELMRAAPGFIGYNVGVGVLFLWYAVAAPHPAPLSWAVGAVHLAIGLAFGAAIVQCSSRV